MNVVGDDRHDKRETLAGSSGVKWDTADGDGVSQGRPRRALCKERGCKDPANLRRSEQ